MQSLTANIQIQIPSDQILIPKEEFEKLKHAELKGTYWSMKDLEKRTAKKQEWIKEKILFPTEFKKILDVENGGFVYYPQKKGQTWSFLASKMAEFLERHFYSIFSN